MHRYIPILLGLLYSCSSLAQIDDQFLVDVDGTQVHVDVAGRSNAPLILYLHGGPANVVFGLVGFRAKVGRELEKNFLIAYLHQRGVGLSPDVPVETQTLANHISDVNHVVDFLEQRYAKDIVTVIGHSWGGALAGLFAERHPEKVDKLVFIAAPLNVKRVLRDGLSVTLQWAKDENRSDAVQQLEGVDPSFNTRQDFGTLSRWANQARGGVMRSVDVPAFIREHEIDKNYPNWQTRQATIAPAMIPEMLTIDLENALPSFHQPALFIAGTDDTIVPVESVRRDFDHYGGEKKLVVLEGAQHLSFMEQPGRVARETIAFLEAH